MADFRGLRPEAGGQKPEAGSRISEIRERRKEDYE
jgi:hypothetical protein